MKTRWQLWVAGIVAILLAWGGAQMTQPLVHGYPDWGRQSAASDLLILDLDLDDDISGPTDYGPFLTGGVPYTEVQFIATQSAKVTLTWSADEASAQVMGRDEIHLRTSGIAHEAVVTRGTWLVISVDLTTYPDDFLLTVMMTPAPGFSNTQNSHNTLLSVDAVSVPAATTRTDTATDVRSGWVYWHADLEGGLNFRHRLYAVEWDGTLHLLDHVTNLNKQGGRMVFAPAMPLRVVTQNSEPATARTLFLVITHVPFMTP